ncbi:MAG: ABC transporter permease [Candidatus Rokuibacteriota bacterium]|nr:MAG: ABC transporter permease [Candidatus Rokubacteria bacterium]
MTMAGPERRRRRRARWLAATLLLSPAVLITGSLLVACLIILRFSFNTWSTTSGMASTWTLDNYVAFASDPFHYKALLTTLRIGVLVTATALVLGYPVAYLLSVSRHKHLILFLIVLPLMMDVLVRAYGWIVLLSRSGLVNRVLVGTGLLARPMQFLGTETAVVLELLHEVLPFTILPIAGVLQRIDPALREAAVGLGAGSVTTFLRVTLPLSLPGLLAGTLLTFSLAMSAFVAPLVLGGGRVPMMSILIQQQMTLLLNWPAGAAQAIVLVALVSLLLLGYDRVLREAPRAGS